jgi:hypothetical protein
MKNLAPIVLFTYNRIDVLKQSIESLKKNPLAKKSNLIIYSDNYKSNKDKKKVLRVREFLKEIKGFNKKKIFYRKRNYGLAKNIIRGVTEVFKKSNKVIVLEDDIKVSKYFLNYMNRSLDIYEKKKKIWHISGWNYNVRVTCTKDAYFTRAMNCWGWATWKDRWQFFQKNPKKIINKWTKREIYRFNLNGRYNFYTQIERNFSKKLNSWAVFWYATIFQNNGLCLNPTKTLVKNIGIGKFSTNTKSLNDIFMSSFTDANFLPVKFPIKMEENIQFLKTIRKKLLKKNKIKNYILKFFK